MKYVDYLENLLYASNHIHTEWVNITLLSKFDRMKCCLDSSTD